MLAEIKNVLTLMISKDCVIFLWMRWMWIPLLRNTEMIMSTVKKWLVSLSRTRSCLK